MSHTLQSGPIGNTSRQDSQPPGSSKASPIVFDSVTEQGVPLPARRNQAFDLMRIGFALLVIFAHSAEITDGNESRELFTRVFHNGMTLGAIGVDGFFLLSGYLILASWLSNPKPTSYLQKRLLRIVPGYAVAVVASICVLGVIAPATPQFFSHMINAKFLGSVLILSSPITPPLFPGLHWNILNGSLWTITYEFSCYLVVLLLGVCGLARRRYFWLILTFLCFALLASPDLGRHLVWHGHSSLRAQRLVVMFLVGGCYWHFRGLLPFRLRFVLVASVLLIAFLFSPTFAEPAVALFGSYLLFFAGSKDEVLSAYLGRLPDISYGLYLYSWPVICLLVWLLHPPLWLTIVMSSILSACLGWLSWHYVERPMLRKKKRPSAQLPVS